MYEKTLTGWIDVPNHNESDIQEIFDFFHFNKEILVDIETKIEKMEIFSNAPKQTAFSANIQH